MNTRTIAAPNTTSSTAGKLSPALVLVAVALLVRIGLIVLSFGVHFDYAHAKYSTHFLNETTNIAASIANGTGYECPFIGVLGGDPKVGPTSWVAPVYPYFCAAVFKLFGVFSRQSFFFLVLLQCVISALTCIPILRLGQLTVGRRPALVAAAVWAVFPWFAQWSITYIWEISLSALLFTCLLWYAVSLENSRARRRWLGFGLLWGFALLVNPALLTLLAASVAWLAWRFWKLHQPSLKLLLLALLACGLVVTPWLARNRLVFGQWVFLRSNFAFEFWLANYHGSHGRDWSGRHPTTNLDEQAHYARIGEMAYVHEKAAASREFLRQYPREFLSLTARRVLMFWDGSTIRYNYPAAPYWLPWSFALLSVLLVPSLILACVRRVRGWPLFLGAILLYPTPYYITFSQVRYRHAIEPLMLLLIAYAAVAALDKLRSQPVIVDA